MKFEVLKSKDGIPISDQPSDQVGDQIGDQVNNNFSDKLLCFTVICLYLDMQIALQGSGLDLDVGINDEDISFIINIVLTTLVRSIIKESYDYFFAGFFKKDSDKVVRVADRMPHSNLIPSDKLVSRL